jgi:hypothetical protein
MNPGRGQSNQEAFGSTRCRAERAELYFEPFCQLAPAFNGRGLLPFRPGLVRAKHAKFHLATAEWNLVPPHSLSGIWGGNGGENYLTSH